jgi:hypothetical protein
VPDIRDSAERMAGLAEKRGPVHPWWAIGKAMVELLDSGDDEAIALVTKEFNRLTQKK